MSVTIRSSRRVAALYRDHLTPPGRALLWALLAAGVLRMGALSPPLYAALASLAALLAVAILAGLPFRPRVHARRRLPGNPTAGKPWFYEVTVENRARFAARDLVLEELGMPAGLVAAPAAEPLPQLATGARAVFSLGLTAARRGAYELSALQAATLFPTGLVKPSRYLQTADRLVVHPRFDRLPDFRLPAGGRSDEGHQATHRDGSELAGLRDWREGDRPRDVHWGAYARSGRLVVRETADDGRPRVALALEGGSEGEHGEACFEIAVSKAAAIAEVLLRQGQALELVVAGDAAHRPTITGQGGLPPVLDLLAVARAGQGLDAALVEAEAQGVSLMILVLPHDRAVPDALVGGLEARGTATHTVRAEAP